MKQSIVHIFLFIIISSFCFNAEARGKWQQIGLDFNAGIIHTHANAPQLNSHNKVTSSSSIDGCFGFGITVYNVYADIVYKPRKYSKDISVKKWNDTRELLAHIGYRIPIQKFYVTPLIGFIITQFGKTDGSDWTINSNGIHNSFHTHTTKVEFDAGAKVGYKIWQYDTMDLDLNITGTFHEAMIGFGITI